MLLLKRTVGNLEKKSGSFVVTSQRKLVSGHAELWLLLSKSHYEVEESGSYIKWRCSSLRQCGNRALFANFAAFSGVTWTHNSTFNSRA